MIPTVYLVGLEGREPRHLYGSLSHLITRAGEELHPGRYYVLMTPVDPDLGTRHSQLATPQDWGTLEVRGPGDWTLRSLAGLQAGPGYVVV